MPTLSSKEITTEVLEPQLSPSMLAAIESTQLMVERLNEVYIEPAKLLSKMINEVYMEPFKQFSESLNRIFEVQNQTIGKMLAAQLSLNKIFSSNLFNFPPPTIKISDMLRPIDVIDGEIELGRSIQPVTPSLPAIQSFSKTKYEEIFDEFSMAITIEGKFYFNDTLLRAISTNSKHGQLLKLLLQNENHYVTDAYLMEAFKPPDPLKGLGYVRDDLIRYLAKDGLKIELYRNRDKDNKGYKLVKISKFNN